MHRAEIYTLIDKFAPPGLAQSWDCSGVVVENEITDIKKIMLALTVTDEVVNQALKNGCDMIVSHHPLFYVPLKYRSINIFCAHTNLDITDGGTTDELIKVLGLNHTEKNEFVRYVELPTPVGVDTFAKKLAEISPDFRYVNNNDVKTIQKIGFCAGSGSEFIETAIADGADAYVTGDIKFHTALESEIVLFDIGHFESEKPVLNVLAGILKDKAETVIADEKSPFLYIK